MNDDERIPVVDLFAGPGGLGEGFSRYPFGGDPRFRICLSIEKEAHAFRTLTTRAFYRQFAPDRVPEAYYNYLRKKFTREELFDYNAECRRAAVAAQSEAYQIELGDKTSEKPDPRKRQRVRKLIDDQVRGREHWVLIGGPPCQAFSLAGRSRMLGVVRKAGENDEELEMRKEQTQKTFASDHRHLLYREYLSIIADHWPPVFVMENVEGILTAETVTSDGELIFPVIKSDLSNPNQALKRKRDGQTYDILSLTVASDDPNSQLKDRDYVVKPELYGVPQQRHRVILVGIRSDVRRGNVPILEKSSGPFLRELFNGLPSLLARVSKPRGTTFSQVLDEASKSAWLRELGEMRGKRSKSEWKRVQDRVRSALVHLRNRRLDSGQEFYPKAAMKSVPGPMGTWLNDDRLGGVCNHTTRSHMVSDLQRYLYCAAFATELSKSPKLKEFPESLLPNHENVQGDKKDLKKHADRFRVQMEDAYSDTITCHISQDGHAFIHPDPTQMRSLTVREAARIQTFPDNYFFEGARTWQYKQVGNAVPPFLAHQIAEVVAQIFQNMG